MTENNNSQFKIHEIIISIAALTLFGVLFFSTQLIKSPFIVFGVILFVLLPFKKSKLIKILLSLSVIIFLIWFFDQISNILIPFIIAFILSYILNPLVEFLYRRKFSRLTSSLLILLSFVAVITVAFIFLIPVIVNQFTELIKNVPAAFTIIQNWVIVTMLPWLASLGIPTQDLESKIASGLSGKMSGIFDFLIGGLGKAFGTLSIIFSQIVNIILIPFLTFYILKDFDDIKALVKKLLPQNSKGRIIEVVRKIDFLMGRYFRGQLTVCLIHGIIVGTFLTIIGVKYSIFLGTLAVLLDFIPYVGLLISLTLSIIASLFSGSPGIQALFTFLSFMGLDLLENSFIAPKIIGEKIGLQPAVLILSLLIFSYFFGFVGLLIALPISSVIIIYFNEWLDKKRMVERTNS